MVSMVVWDSSALSGVRSTLRDAFWQEVDASWCWTSTAGAPASAREGTREGKKTKCNKKTNKQGKRWTPAGAAGPPARGVKRKNATFTNKKQTKKTRQLV